MGGWLVGRGGGKRAKFIPQLDQWGSSPPAIFSWKLFVTCPLPLFLLLSAKLPWGDKGSGWASRPFERKLLYRVFCWPNLLRISQGITACSAERSWTRKTQSLRFRIRAQFSLIRCQHHIDILTQVTRAPHRDPNFGGCRHTWTAFTFTRWKWIQIGSTCWRQSSCSCFVSAADRWSSAPKEVSWRMLRTFWHLCLWSTSTFWAANFPQLPTQISTHWSWVQVFLVSVWQSNWRKWELSFGY